MLATEQVTWTKGRHNSSTCRENSAAVPPGGLRHDASSRGPVTTVRSVPRFPWTRRARAKRCATASERSPTGDLPCPFAPSSSRCARGLAGDDTATTSTPSFRGRDRRLTTSRPAFNCRSCRTGTSIAHPVAREPRVDAWSRRKSAPRGRFVVLWRSTDVKQYTAPAGPGCRPLEPGAARAENLAEESQSTMHAASHRPRAHRQRERQKPNQDRPHRRRVSTCACGAWRCVDVTGPVYAAWSRAPARRTNCARRCRRKKSRGSDRSARDPRRVSPGAEDQGRRRRQGGRSTYAGHGTIRFFAFTAVSSLQVLLRRTLMVREPWASCSLFPAIGRGAARAAPRKVSGRTLRQLRRRASTGPARAAAPVVTRTEATEVDSCGGLPCS